MTIQMSDINFPILTYEVNAGIYVCDPEGTFIYANMALADLFDVKHPRDIIGRNFKNFIVPEFAHGFVIQFRKSMESGTNSKLILTQIIRQSGKIRYVEVHAMPFIKNNKLLGNQGVVHDITYLKQAETEMMYAGTHDPLTGIYNPTFFEAEMKRLERGRQFPIGIIVVIVWGTQRLSEFGAQEEGVELIKSVAHSLYRSLRGDEIVARIENEKFAILLPNADEIVVDRIVNRIRGNLMKINIEERKPALEFYIGAGNAKMGEELNSVLNRAELIANLEEKKNKPQ